MIRAHRKCPIDTSPDSAIYHWLKARPLNHQHLTAHSRHVAKMSWMWCEYFRFLHYNILCPLILLSSTLIHCMWITLSSPPPPFAFNPAHDTFLNLFTSPISILFGNGWTFVSVMTSIWLEITSAFPYRERCNPVQGSAHLSSDLLSVTALALRVTSQVHGFGNNSTACSLTWLCTVGLCKKKKRFTSGFSYLSLPSLSPLLLSLALAPSISRPSHLLFSLWKIMYNFTEISINTSAPCTSVYMHVFLGFCKPSGTINRKKGHKSSFINLEGCWPGCCLCFFLAVCFVGRSVTVA